jgi:hypothetical protein
MDKAATSLRLALPCLAITLCLAVTLWLAWSRLL